jgi:hypothetical protein
MLSYFNQQNVVKFNVMKSLGKNNNNKRTMTIVDKRYFKCFFFILKCFIESFKYIFLLIISTI